MRRVLAAATLVALLSACAVPIGHFTAMGDPAQAGGREGELVVATGRTCRWWIVGVPLGLPRIEDAVADALAHAGARGVLIDVDLVSFHPVYGLVGPHCYVVSGRAVRFDAGDGTR